MKPATGRRIVVKLGGGGSLDLGRLAAEVAELCSDEYEVVVVHGGREEIDAVAHQLGHAPRHVRSLSGVASRLTDAHALDALMLGLLGRRNPALTMALTQCGVPAVGLSGLAARTVTARRRKALKVQMAGRSLVVRDDLSGTIAEVDPGLLILLLDHGYVPVLSPPADGGEDGPLNIDSDTMAAAIAVAVSADALVVLSDVPGVLEDVEDPSSIVSELDTARLPESVRGRMHHKVRAAASAARSVPYVVIADGRRSRAVDQALRGAGTRILLRSGTAQTLARRETHDS